MVCVIRVRAAAKKEAATGEKRKFYSEDMRFEDGGIYDPKAREQTLQLFDLRIVQAGPRGVRKHLWDYVFNKMKHTALPDNRVLYLEMDAQSAWKFEGSKAFTRDLTTSHGHGESDPSLAFWLEYTCFHVREGKTAVVRSKDGDCIPILLYAIEMQERHAPPHYVRKPVYWMQSYQNIWDMRLYHSKVKSKYKFTISQYMIYCILCKTDFFEKSLICNGFGSSKIFDAMECVKEEFNIWEAPLAQGETQAERDAKELLALEAFVRQLYQNFFTGNVRGLMSVVSNKNNEGVNHRPKLYSWERLQEMSDHKAAKSIKMPTRENLLKAYTQLSFNYRYWRDRSKWPKGMFGTLPPTQRRAEQFMRVGTPASSVAASASSSSSAAASSSSSSSSSAAAASSSSPEMPPRRQVGMLSPLPRVMRTAERAAEDDAAIAAAAALQPSPPVRDWIDDIIDIGAQNLGTAAKKPRVSAASVIAAAAASSSSSAASASSFHKDFLNACLPLTTDVDRLNAELEATKGELTPREQEVEHIRCGGMEPKSLDMDSDEEQKEKWVMVPPAPTEKENTSPKRARSIQQAIDLIEELDEAAEQFKETMGKALPAPPVTRAGYFDMFQGVIHRAMGGTNRSGQKRKTPSAK